MDHQNYKHIFQTVCVFEATSGLYLCYSLKAVHQIYMQAHSQKKYSLCVKVRSKNSHMTKTHSQKSNQNEISIRMYSEEAWKMSFKPC